MKMTNFHRPCCEGTSGNHFQDSFQFLQREKNRAVGRICLPESDFIIRSSLVMVLVHHTARSHACACVHVSLNACLTFAGAVYFLENIAGNVLLLNKPRKQRQTCAPITATDYGKAGGKC